MGSEKILDGKDYLMEIDTDTPLDAERGGNYRAIVCEVSSVFSIETDEIAASSRCDPDWRSRLPNKSSFSFSGEWQAIDPATGDPSAVTMNEIARLAASRDVFWARRKLVDGATGIEVLREGRVWINRYEDTASTDDPFTFTADFVGVGAPIVDAGYERVAILTVNTDEGVKLLEAEDGKLTTVKI